MTAWYVTLRGWIQPDCGYQERPRIYAQSSTEAIQAALSGMMPGAHIEKVVVDPVERFDGGRTETTMVFGTCRSDALRRAQAPARLGEAFAHTQWQVAEIADDWDDPVVWPLDSVAA